MLVAPALTRRGAMPAIGPGRGPSRLVNTVATAAVGGGGATGSSPPAVAPAASVAPATQPLALTLSAPAALAPQPGILPISPPAADPQPSPASAAAGPSPFASSPSPPAPSTSRTTAPPSPMPAPAAPEVATGPNDELLARRKQRVTAEILEAARKARVPAGPEQICAGLDTLESLLPGFTPNLDALKASEWARLAADAPSVASKLILLKTHFPRLDIARVVAARPQLLLQPPQQLDRAAQQIRSLLSRARDMERLLAAEPALMDPRALVSVLITVTKWYQLERDPVEVLEADPELVRRAQDYDVPFEPVYMDEHGNWTAPLLNYREKRTEWQKYIDQTFYKQP